MAIPERERPIAKLIDRFPRATIPDLLVDSWFHTEIRSRRETIFTGLDIDVKTEGQRIASGIREGFRLVIPYGYFKGLGVSDRTQEELLALEMVASGFTTIRSKFAQAGAGSIILDKSIRTPYAEVAIQRDDKHFEVPILVHGYNPYRSIIFPESGTIPLCRLYLPAGWTSGRELYQAANSMVVDQGTREQILLRGFDLKVMTLKEADQLPTDDPHFNIGSDQVFYTLSLAIVHHGHFREEGLIKATDLNAKMDRRQLDSVLGVEWGDVSGGVTEYAREFYLGETIPLLFNGFVGNVIAGAEDVGEYSQWIHATSTIIDDGFSGVIRTEEMVDMFPGQPRIYPPYAHLAIYHA